ncbi:hypothetical protein [Streptomyces sp. NBC_01750]|uniref:hypothetical protein n=1 Tax=Streptomyces sp. NBC_01750 TaxID=2975928 RepID=UPI002DD87717|nr:hypothetical protein [Streptomyces sp. NBC_01750]WSD33549.1 hypothetical protein OG966_17550 [Streptomyces sp. NBC_01750]
MTRCRSGTGSRDHVPSADQAREAAQRFVRDNVSGFLADRRLVGREAVSHLDGDALRLPRRRAVEAGKAGARAVTAEVDRRTGAVVRLSAARGTADAASCPVSAEDAIAAARAAVDDEHLPTTVAGGTWHAGRWTVTIDRGPSGRAEALSRDIERLEIERLKIERLEIDARTRAVLGHRGAYEIDADRSLPVAGGAPRTMTRYRYGGEVTPAAPDVEETPGGAAPGATPPLGIRTLTMSRTTPEACIPGPYTVATDDGIGRESGDGSENRFHGDGLGMVYETGNYRAEAAAHHYLQPNPCTFTPKGISPTSRHKKISGNFCVRFPVHRHWSGFLRPAAAERPERPRGDRPQRRQPIPQSGYR